MADHPLLEKHWVPRSGATSLAAAIEDRDWSNWYAWAGPESGSLKHLRTRLRDDFGFPPKSEVHAQAYWYHGRAMGKLRSTETEETTTAPVPAEKPVETTPISAQSDRGTWQAQAGGRLVSPAEATLVTAGVVQAIVTLIQLAPVRTAHRTGPPDARWRTVGATVESRSVGDR